MVKLKVQTTADLMMEDSEYRALLQEMDSYIVHIDEDPSADLGIFLKSLHITNKYTQRVGAIALKALFNEQSYRDLFSDVKRTYDSKYNGVMQGDEKIQNLKNQALREAAASAFLEEEATALAHATGALERATNFRKITERKLELLKDASDKLSRQITVVERMIDIGLIRGKKLPGE